MDLLKELLTEYPNQHEAPERQEPEMNMRQVVEFVFHEAEEEAFEDANQTGSAVHGDAIAEHAKDLLDEVLRLIHHKIDKEYGQGRNQ